MSGPLKAKPFFPYFFLSFFLFNPLVNNHTQTRSVIFSFTISLFCRRFTFFLENMHIFGERGYGIFRLQRGAV